MKYVELLDTVFLMLRKRPLEVLHCYHHGATVILCYTQLVGRTAVSWVPIMVNLAVHVVMYWYFYQSSRGVRVWWKRYVTVFQIAQFVIDLGFVFFASYSYFAATYRPAWPHYGTCAGTESAAVAGVVILTSYLGLFVNLFYDMYIVPKNGGIRCPGPRKRSETPFQAKARLFKTRAVPFRAQERPDTMLSMEPKPTSRELPAASRTTGSRSVPDVPQILAQRKPGREVRVLHARDARDAPPSPWMEVVQGGKASDEDGVAFVEHVERVSS